MAPLGIVVGIGALTLAVWGVGKPVHAIGHAGKKAGCVIMAGHKCQKPAQKPPATAPETDER